MCVSTQNSRHKTISEIAPTLTLIFQASLDQGTLPEVWKQAIQLFLFTKRTVSQILATLDLSHLATCSYSYALKINIETHYLLKCIKLKHLQSHAVRIMQCTAWLSPK